jgi:hyperosmotically inducible protein
MSMSKDKLFILVLLVSAVFLINLPGAGWAQPADNTKINKRDRSPKEVTADQQGQSKADREITQKIRRAIVNDKSLSTNAHNVKIITVDGVVPLKGPVASEDEKGIIEEKAAQIAGNNWLSRNVV